MTEEIELKFCVRSPAALRARLKQLGFRVARPRARERNWLFDDARGSLRAAGKVLRLRRSGGIWLLTAKGPRRAGALKRRAEAQTTLADGTACRALLALAGFFESGSYALWRTLYRRPRPAGEVAWDETAAGTYLEIEGTAAWVRRTAAALGLDPAAAEPRSYPEILKLARPPKGRKSKAPAD